MYLSNELPIKKDVLKNKNVCKLGTGTWVALSREEASDQTPDPDEQVISKDVTAELEAKDRTLLLSICNHSFKCMEFLGSF